MRVLADAHQATALLINGFVFKHVSSFLVATVLVEKTIIKSLPTRWIMDGVVRRTGDLSLPEPDDQVQTPPETSGNGPSNARDAGNVHIDGLKSIGSLPKTRQQAVDTDMPASSKSESDAQVGGPVHGENAAAVGHVAVPIELSPSSSGLPADLKQEIRGVAQQLAVEAVVVMEPGDPQAPVPGVWRNLQAIASMRSSVSSMQLAEIEGDLRAAISASAHPPADTTLLRDVVSEITHPDGLSLSGFMADRVYAGLCLPNLQMVESGEEEPNSRTFNSILPNLAESAYDYNPLGRTLVWEGACALVAGPRQADRRERLRKVVFELPNIPNEGEPKLENPWDFIMAIDELRVDEDVDLDALRGKSQ
ncbi:type III effector protein [Paraburkholderia sp. CI3]|uniref:type III effector protein n=1 Tax=Paraburkholderia sp. CI3 TaxID=2991060 RepID=UPI003D236E10